MTTEPAERAAGLSTGAARVAVAFALLALAAIWSTGLHAPFVYDDKIEVVGNPTLRIFTEFSAIATYNVSRPLLILTYALNWAWGGLDPVGYHVVSIAIHLANVILVGLVLRHLVSVRVAGATALMWGLHPMCVQGVTYVTGRSDALCAMFWLASSWAWLRRKNGWTILFVTAALLTKELAVLLPLWLWFLTPHRRLDTPPWKMLAGMVGLVCLGGALRIGVMGWPAIEVHRSPWQQAVLQAVAWDRYALLWVLPYGQSVLHDPPALERWPLWPMISLILWMGAILAVLWARSEPPWRARIRWPLPALGCLFIVCWLLPSAVVPLKESIAEHRAYLVGVPLIAGVCAWLEVRGLLVRLGSILTLGLAALTIQQNRIWSNEVTLWRTAAELNPESADANYGYADALRFAGESERAEAAYRVVLALRPDDENASINLGICRAEQGDPQGARAIWQAVTRAHPRSCAAHDNLGAWARRYATLREADDEYASAFKWCPNDPNALLNLGDLNWDQGETRLARRYYQRYLDVLPFGAEAGRVRKRL